MIEEVQKVHQQIASICGDLNIRYDQALGCLQLLRTQPAAAACDCKDADLEHFQDTIELHGRLLNKLATEDATTRMSIAKLQDAFLQANTHNLKQLRSAQLAVRITFILAIIAAVLGIIF